MSCEFQHENEPYFTFQVSRAWFRSVNLTRVTAGSRLSTERSGKVELIIRHARSHLILEADFSTVNAGCRDNDEHTDNSLYISMTDVVQPDIVFISAERSHTITKKNIIAAPDLVVEILSESTSKVDRTKKKLLYEKSGVKEYWLADPDNQTIEQLILTGKGFSEGRIHRKGKFVDSKVLKGLRFDAGAVFSV